MVIEIPVNLLDTKKSGDEIRREIAIALHKSGLLPLKNAAKFLGIKVDDFRKLVADGGEVVPMKNAEKRRPVIADDPILLALAKPIKEKFDFEQILREQHYEGTSTERIKRLIREMDVKDDLDEMLAMLTR